MVSELDVIYMKKTKEQLLSALKKREKDCRNGRWLYPIMSIFNFVCGGYIFHLYLKFFKEIIESKSTTMDIKAFMISILQLQPITSMLFIGMGLYLFLKSLEVWTGNPEREAILYLLENEENK
jgi:hypothetical protein